MIIMKKLTLFSKSLPPMLDNLGASKETKDLIRDDKKVCRSKAIFL